jgi:hypothetical protein
MVGPGCVRAGSGIATGRLEAQHIRGAGKRRFQVPRYHRWSGAPACSAVYLTFRATELVPVECCALDWLRARHGNDERPLLPVNRAVEGENLEGHRRGANRIVSEREDRAPDRPRHRCATPTPPMRHPSSMVCSGCACRSMLTMRWRTMNAWQRSWRLFCTRAHKSEHRI